MQPETPIQILFRFTFPMATALLAACSGDDASNLPDAGPGADAPAADAPSSDGPPVSTAALRLADVVIASPGASGTGFGDPQRAVNGIKGGGLSGGSVDVYSLSLLPALNQSITLGWSNNGRLANGPGADLVIFENGFDTSVGPFMDLIAVEVSRDGVTWRPLARDYVTADETVYVRDRAAWVGFAGKTPVLYDTTANPVNPFDAALAGGDQLDLETVTGTDAEAAAIRAEGVTQVRLIAAPSLINPDTGALFVRDSFANGADLDGMIGRYVTP